MSTSETVPLLTAIRIRGLKKILGEEYYVYYFKLQNGEYITVAQLVGHNNSVRVSPYGAVRMDDNWEICKDGHDIFTSGNIISMSPEDIAEFVKETWSKL